MKILSKEQKKILSKFFEADPQWKKSTVKQAILETGLERIKVYKWGSDKRRKLVRKMQKSIYGGAKTKFAQIEDFKDLNKVVSQVILMSDNGYRH